MEGTLTYVMCFDAVTYTKATKESRGLKLHASDRQEMSRHSGCSLVILNARHV